jgi:transposase
MDGSLVFSLGEGLVVERVECEATTLTVFVASTSLAARCPLCQELSDHLHSHYQRMVADLPCGGRQVRLLVCVPKFRCKTPTCPRQVFAERLAPLIEPWARQTTRLIEALQAIGLATCGEGGARLAEKLSLPTSPTTLLRRIMALPTEPVKTVIELGIDDFSFRRGRTFGTILVDVRTHQVLDLLPDRTTATSAAWMRGHPEIEVVSRDRGGDYAAAALAAVPQAIQCADRFHVLTNLSKSVEGLLSRHLAAQRTRVNLESRATSLSTAFGKGPPKQNPKHAEVCQAKREERLAQYQQVVALRNLGFAQTAIAAQVGISHATVSRWLRNGTFPEHQSPQRRTKFDPHLKAVAERWEAGCHNIAQVHRELVAAGHTITYRNVYRQLVRYLPEGRKKSSSDSRLPRATVLARDAVFLLLRSPEALEAEDQETLALLRSLHEEVDQAYELVQQFTQMLRTRTGEQLDAWLSTVQASKIRELQGFVAGVIRDKEAVKAGLMLPWSNGVVEGKVNKLKLIKRTMYGRASFALLRQRVLHAA